MSKDSSSIPVNPPTPKTSEEDLKLFCKDLIKKYKGRAGHNPFMFERDLWAAWSAATEEKPFNTEFLSEEYYLNQYLQKEVHTMVRDPLPGVKYEKPRDI